MKLVQFGSDGVAGRRRHLGALVAGTADDGVIIDLTAGARAVLEREGRGSAAARELADAIAPACSLRFIRAGETARHLAERSVVLAVEAGVETDQFGAQLRYAAEDVTILPAITEPPMLRDFMAFEKHLLNVFPALGRAIPTEWYERPVYYKGNTASIGAHGEDVAFPPYTEQLDLEFEFAAILARGGTDIDEADARSHIYGYTIYNDFSARAIQTKEMTVGLGPAKGKDFHAGHVLGPVLVTADEIPDPYALHLRAEINGDVWADGSSADMSWRFEQMIAYASMGEPLRAGEVFGSGTVGDGSGAEQGKWLEPGDETVLTVEGIGALRNRVIAHGEAPRRKEYL